MRKDSDDSLKVIVLVLMAMWMAMSIATMAWKAWYYEAVENFNEKAAKEILFEADSRADEWDTPFVLGEAGDFVRSAGPDKEFGTEDDLTWFRADLNAGD